MHIKIVNYTEGFPLTLFFLLAVCGESCTKLVTVDPPITMVTTAVVFNNDKSATSAIAGLYASMMQTTSYFANSAMTIFPGMSADELYNTDAGTTNTQFSVNAIAASNGVVDGNFWRPAYNYIYQANTIIEGLAKSTSVSVPVKNQLTGEAKFIRAFCHFYLANLFGPVPLVNTSDYVVNAATPRVSTDSIYASVINDLVSASDQLNAAYITGTPTRVNKWAATALLSRVYLYAKQYSKAETAATQVISSGAYNLETDISKTFLAGSKEVIFQLATTPGTANTYEGNIFIPTTGNIPAFALASFQVNSFDSGDQRKTIWMGNIIVNGTTYYYPYKYKVKTAATVTENYVVLRYAELYLIRAEARAQQNNITPALNDLNIIRVRAGLTAAISNSAADLLLRIEKERRTELFAEWGHRWFDLKRTNRADAVLGSEKSPGWQSTDALYPIPVSQITANSLLVQNPGY